jgi:hypothetical protein
MHNKLKLMKTNHLVALAVLLFAGVFYHSAEAQGVLQKVKNRTEDKLLDKVFDDKKESPKEAGEKTSSSRSRSSNTKGEGLSQTAPNVTENISGAETAMVQRNFGQSRYHVRQAILGIELEIGDKILKGLPDNIDGLPINKEEDRVTSSGIGFVGLIIERTYLKDDKELKLTIGNDAAMLSAVNMYMASGAYATSSDQNYKQVQFKGHRAVIEYDDYSGYKLSVPFGQSSIFIAEGINYANEQSLMSAAENIDLEKIKKELGEN